MLTHVKTVSIYAADQERALRFWTDQVGFEVRRVESMGPGGRWIEVGPPGAHTILVIYPRSMMEDWAQRKPSIVFASADTRATYEALSRRGVEFTQEPRGMAWGNFAIFVDPDGNEFGISDG